LSASDRFAGSESGRAQRARNKPAVFRLAVGIYIKRRISLALDPPYGEYIVGIPAELLWSLWGFRRLRPL
jgi:hypothetical protein